MGNLFGIAVLIMFILLILGKSLIDEIQNIVPKFGSRGQFKGLGGELMKQACAVLIKKASSVHFPIHNTKIVGKELIFQFIIQNN